MKYDKAVIAKATDDVVKVVKHMSDILEEDYKRMPKTDSQRNPDDIVQKIGITNWVRLPDGTYIKIHLSTPDSDTDTGYMEGTLSHQDTYNTYSTLSVDFDNDMQNQVEHLLNNPVKLYAELDSKRNIITVNIEDAFLSRKAYDTCAVYEVPMADIDDNLVHIYAEKDKYGHILSTSKNKEFLNKNKQQNIEIILLQEEAND